MWHVKCRDCNVTDEFNSAGETQKQAEKKFIKRGWKPGIKVQGRLQLICPECK